MMLGEERVTGAQPLVLTRAAGEDTGEGLEGVVGVWVWFSGRGESLVGEEGWELRRLVKLAIRPRARIAFPVFWIFRKQTDKPCS